MKFNNNKFVYLNSLLSEKDCAYCDYNIYKIIFYIIIKYSSIVNEWLRYTIYDMIYDKYIIMI